MNKKLTLRQQELYDFYVDPKNWRFLPPTLADCKAHLKVKSDQTILATLDRIRNAGHDISKPSK